MSRRYGQNGGGEYPGSRSQPGKWNESSASYAPLDPSSSSMLSTVERASLRPVGRSLTAVRFFHLATVFWLIPQRWARTLRLS